MRITFLTPAPNLSGGIRVVALHASWLRSRGHEVRIAHPPPGAHGPSGLRGLWRDARSFLRSTPPEPNHFDGLDLPRILLPASRPPVDQDIPDADVIVATWWETAEWMARLSPAKGAQVYFVQGHEVFDHMPKDRVRATYRLPVHIVTVSQWLLHTLRNEYGATGISLVPNGVDLGRFHAVARDRQPAPTVGMLYSSIRIKGCDIALEAVKFAKRQLPGLRLVAFGVEKVPPRELPLPSFAEYVARPPQDCIPALYAGCDVWLFASRSEGFGLPILEAMACRTPVIAAPAGAAPELLAEGGGKLVRPENPREMADAINDLCAGPAAGWSRASELALRTAREHPWERAHRDFEEALLRTAERLR